jgi:magnesium transporter
MIRFIERGSGGSAAIGEFDAERVRRLIGDPSTHFWVDLSDPSDEETEVLASVFRFHPLTIDDCIFDVASPKLDVYDGYLFLVIHAIEYDSKAKKLEPIELDCYLGPNYVVTFHYPTVRPIEEVMSRCRSSSRTMNRGAEFILHEVLDALVDEYIPVSESLDRQLDVLEERVIHEPKREVLLEILELKRVVVHLRRLLVPQREVLRKIGNDESDLVSREGRLFFRDVHDHLYRVSELTELHREMITSALEAYLSSVSNRLNEVMKVLTIIATLILPLTLITGIYGMNFHYMPELRSPYGYPAALLLMAAVAAGMLTYFKRRGWL